MREDDRRRHLRVYPERKTRITENRNRGASAGRPLDSGFEESQPEEGGQCRLRRPGCAYFRWRIKCDARRCAPRGIACPSGQSITTRPLPLSAPGPAATFLVIMG